MDEPQHNLAETSDIKNVLPDVVHSQQISTLDNIADDASNSTKDKSTHDNVLQDETEIQDSSGAESISENIPFKIEYSMTESEPGQSFAGNLLKIETSNELLSKNSSLNIPPDSSQQYSWNIDVNQSDIHISEESPIILALSSDTSKDILKSHEPAEDNSNSKDLEQFSKSEYLDSLNNTISQKSNENNDGSLDDKSSLSSEKDAKSLGQCSSNSEEIIKLDIRGKAAPKFPIQATRIIFGPPPEGSAIMNPHIEPLPVFHNLLSPYLVGANDGVTIEEVLDDKFDTFLKAITPEKSLSLSASSASYKEQDVLVEEITVEDGKKGVNMADGSPTKSLNPDETSLNTISTEYKTLCEEYQFKLVHMEKAISHRDQLIEELTVSLQRSVRDQEDLRHENKHLVDELQNLQHVVGERSNSENDTIKAQLSDFMKYQCMMKDETKFYSALMSGTTSLQSSNGEKDNDKEEMTINYSKSDLRSSESSDDFQTLFDNKLMTVLNKYEGYIEENLRNKLRESLIQILCEEIGKMRINFDTDMKEIETQLNREKQSHIIEAHRLRELLSSLKTGNVEIEKLREELDVKHNKEMENLRTYFEKKCLDIECSYSEQEMHGRGCVSPVSGGGEGGETGGEGGAGDARRRTSSADLPALMVETSTPIEGTLRQINKKLEQRLEEMKTEHISYIHELKVRHKENIKTLDEQINQLKAHIQTTENIEANVSVYQQDIDLELEKRARARVLRDMNQQLQVLLSDPDAELSSWPLELVALRDRIHADRELSSVRDDVSAADGDKWRQRRNNSFDQNRQLEEVTKERDDLRRVASVLQRAVASLVAYCASAEDELNRTVLTRLLGHLAPDPDLTLEAESRSSSPAEERRVHLAPDLQCVLAALEEAGAPGVLQHQRDLGADIRRELDASLQRLRLEAQDLLELSERLAISKARRESRMLENSTRLLDDDRPCNDCNVQRKNMEEAMSECLQRETLLRSDLDAAMMKIAHLADPSHDHTRTNSDVIAEGYGTCGSPRAAPPAEDLDAALRERDDLTQQLEAANRKLLSTRRFLEEQGAEREAERDEYEARLGDLREENARLAARLHSSTRILSEVERLEAQTREMNQTIADLESRKRAADDGSKAAEEKTLLLRDIIADLEGQLERKSAGEAEVLRRLEEMRRTIDDRDERMRVALGELEALRAERAAAEERAAAGERVCERCDGDPLRDIEEDARRLEDALHRSAMKLESAHERASESHSPRTEDVSPRAEGGVGAGGASVLAGAWERARALERAEDAALKRVADLEMQRARLKDAAQEVRAERDVLQARMSEQALRISSLSARLAQQRCDADALAHSAAAQLSVRLHDAQAEVQRLTEELVTKDKQLARLKQSHDDRDKHGVPQPLYGNSCNPKDQVVILERDLSNAQSKIAQLESLVRSLETDKDKLQSTVREQQRTLAEKEEQLNEIMALNLEDEHQSEVIQAKASARTLSDIVSISEFDEQDLLMRRAELKGQNISITGAQDYKDKTNLNKTLPPDVQKPSMSSLNLDYIDNFNATNFTPRADSLPIHLTSTQNKDTYKRNTNETTIFGEGMTHLIAQNIPDNCSMYPNRDISDSKDVSVEPKKINFSLQPSDNKTYDEEFTSLKELGITLDVKQENFPDILTKLKHEIKKSRSELEVCKSDLKNAEEQLCEFPALKEEVEELKELLENTMATMENDKKFYENQLESFSSNKKLLEQRLNELTQEVSEKSKDLHLLKEDILRRENMILELAKEKRNLSNKISELEMKIDELKNKNTILEQYELENKQLREKINELQRLEQLVSEKNQQIDSLNQHLDRLDDMQRCLNDKTEEMEGLKEALNKKTNELFQMRDSINSLNTDIAKVIEENDQLSYQNKELKLKLTKVEKEQENSSIKLQNSESELDRLNSLNGDLTSRIGELKILHEKLKDKETEIEILQEDINLYHNEIAALKEQLKMVSRSPSPRNKSIEGNNTPDRQASNDKKQLAKIKKQISLLQHELDFHKKELNDKAFELAKAKLDLTEARSIISQMSKQVSDNEQLRASCQEHRQSMRQLEQEKQTLERRLETVLARLREECDMEELRDKLRSEGERCGQLERELQRLRELTDRSVGSEMHLDAPHPTPARARFPTAELQRLRELADRSADSEMLLDAPSPTPARARSPTAELERAVRDQLDYSHALDDDIMDQILSASSDEREDIPRLALDESARSTSSVRSSSSERLRRLRTDNEKLQLKLEHLECRLKDKDALIAELNRVRDKMSGECESARLRLEAERDRSARLALLLDSHKDTASSLHNQDSSMIDMLKRRLESAMKSEMEVQERERELLRRLQRPPATPPSERLQEESEERARLQGTLGVLRTQLQQERRRGAELLALLEHARAAHQQDRAAAAAHRAQHYEQLAELRRLKRDSGAELVRANELLRTQTDAVARLERKLAAGNQRNDTFAEIENEKTDPAREMAPRGRCLEETVRPPTTRPEGRGDDKGDDKDRAIRYLHGRGVRLESCRKALVWQKRYLQRALAGYGELERRLGLPADAAPAGRRRFKCVAWSCVAVLRMAYLVRRRDAARGAAAALLPCGSAPPADTPRPPPVARRLLQHDFKLGMPSSPTVGDSARRSPFGANSPREDYTGSPRGAGQTPARRQQ